MTDPGSLVLISSNMNVFQLQVAAAVTSASDIESPLHSLGSYAPMTNWIIDKDNFKTDEDRTLVTEKPSSVSKTTDSVSLTVTGKEDGGGTNTTSPSGRCQ